MIMNPLVLQLAAEERRRSCGCRLKGRTDRPTNSPTTDMSFHSHYERKNDRCQAIFPPSPVSVLYSSVVEVVKNDAYKKLDSLLWTKQRRSVLSARSAALYYIWTAAPSGRHLCPMMSVKKENEKYCWLAGRRSNHKSVRMYSVIYLNPLTLSGLCPTLSGLHSAPLGFVLPCVFLISANFMSHLGDRTLNVQDTWTHHDRILDTLNGQKKTKNISILIILQSSVEHLIYTSCFFLIN